MVSVNFSGLNGFLPTFVNQRGFWSEKEKPSLKKKHRAFVSVLRQGEWLLCM